MVMGEGRVCVRSAGLRIKAVMGKTVRALKKENGKEGKC